MRLVLVVMAALLAVSFGAHAEPASSRASTSGNGSLSVGASVNINTLTINGSIGPLPTNIAGLIVTNMGATNAALCMGGGTCTCAENAVDSSNGVPIVGNGGGYVFNLVSVPWTRPTIVSCSGAAVPITFVWGS